MSTYPTGDTPSYEQVVQEMEQRLYDPLPEGLVEADWLVLPEIEQDWFHLPVIEREWLDSPDIDRDWLAAPTHDSLEQKDLDIAQDVTSVDHGFDLSDR